MAPRTVKKPAARRPAKAPNAMTVSAYLAAAPKDQRPALIKLRKTVEAAAPKATATLRYGIVGFMLRGEPILHFGYWKTHVALYGGFGAHAAELKRYDQTGKGTVRFPVNRPLPYALVTKIVKARVAEIERAR